MEKSTWEPYSGMSTYWFSLFWKCSVYFVQRYQQYRCQCIWHFNRYSCHCHVNGPMTASKSQPSKLFICGILCISKLPPSDTEIYTTTIDKVIEWFRPHTSVVVRWNQFNIIKKSNYVSFAESFISHLSSNSWESLLSPRTFSFCFAQHNRKIGGMPDAIPAKCRLGSWLVGEEGEKYWWRGWGLLGLSMNRGRKGRNGTEWDRQIYRVAGKVAGRTDLIKLIASDVCVRILLCVCVPWRNSRNSQPNRSYRVKKFEGKNDKKVVISSHKRNQVFDLRTLRKFDSKECETSRIWICPSGMQYFW